ncbi:hypothetical protein DNI29_18885 [Hymenobacter sediminis]|uniref:hypothetical protein n=1 Tax=Hymenobacter sediminis TaxID=2218621 RepID=UPI000F4F1FFC|nr:hypothetical protein [Hymenobacter sediminis]RPD45447.1 hypothetical protein DNI29_18885 [Hymenobacter sediminis]
MQQINRACSACLLSAFLLTGCQPSLEEKVQNPQKGDVYVVQFQPQGTTTARYFFYELYRVTPDSVYLHPARTDAATADAAAPDMFAQDKSLPYTRAETRELLQEQPGDVLHSRLIEVRR